jgi:hypothetical protein
MLIASCCHDTNASISSKLCDANHIDETDDSLGQDKVLNGASINSSSSSSHGSHICLIARSSNRSDVEDNGKDEDNEEDYIESLNEKGFLKHMTVGEAPTVNFLLIIWRMYIYNGEEKTEREKKI